MINTEEQFDQIIAVCRYIYAKKLHDYGAAWRSMRSSSYIDLILEAISYQTDRKYSKSDSYFRGNRRYDQLCHIWIDKN